MTQLIKSFQLPLSANVLVVFSLGSTLILPNGHAYGTLIFSLFGIFLILYRRLPSLHFFGRPLLATASFFFIHASIMIWHGEPIKEFEYLAPFVFLPLVVIGLFSVNVRPESVWVGLMIAAITAGLLPLIQMLLADGPQRFSGLMSNPIPYGNVCVLLATACLVGLSTFARQSSSLVKTGLVLGLALALVGTLLSGSKGGWLSIALTWPLLLVWAFRQMQFRQALFVIALLAIVGSTAAFSPSSTMLERLKQGGQAALALATHLISGNEVKRMPDDGSVGVRAAMWRHALQGPVLENPVLGVPRAQLRASQREAVEQGKEPSLRKDWAHLHNDSVDVLATKGIVGLAALIGLWGGWLSFFVKQYRRAMNPTYQGLALVGFLVLVQLAEFSMSGSQLRYLSVSIFSGFLMVVIAACLNFDRPNAKQAV